MLPSKRYLRYSQTILSTYSVATFVTWGIVMSSSGMVFLVASVILAPAPAKLKDTWVGQSVCMRAQTLETYERTGEGKFELKPFYLRYLDVRVVAEDGDYIQIQHDADTIWVKKKDTLRARDAILFYTQVLEKTPTDERAISCRMWAYMTIGDYDRALLDANEAIRLSPGSAAWLNNRGEVLIKKREYEKAVKEFDNILQNNPQYFFGLHNRSEALLRLKKFERALEDINLCLANEGKVPQLHANKARILASAPDAKLRDGKKALESALLALSQVKYKDGRVLESVAIAYAELGDFEKAVEYQSKVLDDNEYMKEEGEQPRKLLKLFRDKKPFRDE